MNNIIIDKSYLVEVPVVKSSTSQIIYFPILQNLDGKLTQGISTYSITNLLKSPTNIPLANDNLLKSSYLMLIQGDVNQVWNIPLVDLITVHNDSGTVPHNDFAIELDNLRIIWAKSYVFIADVSTISGAQNESFVFNIKYIDDPNPPKK